MYRRFTFCGPVPISRVHPHPTRRVRRVRVARRITSIAFAMSRQNLELRCEQRDDEVAHQVGGALEQHNKIHAVEKSTRKLRRDSIFRDRGVSRGVGQRINAERPALRSACRGASGKTKPCSIRSLETGSAKYWT